MSHRQVLRHSLSEARRREEGVYSDAEGAVQHVGDDSLEYGALCRLDAGVSVDFDELHLEVRVQHEVIAEDFEAMRALVRIYVLIDSTKGVRDYTFDLRPEDVSLEVDTKLGVRFVKVLLIVLEGDLVAYFMLAIVICLLLDSIVR